MNVANVGIKMWYKYLIDKMWAQWATLWYLVGWSFYTVASRKCGRPIVLKF